MKLALFSHCAIDTITIDGETHEQIGGAACYGGLTARELKFDVLLYTKFGKDFPQQYLTQNKLNFENGISEKLTTRFAINITGSDRTLKLLNACELIDYNSIDSDGSLITPIFHEISSEIFSKIKKDYYNIYILCLIYRYSYIDSNNQQLAINYNVKKIFKSLIY